MHTFTRLPLAILLLLCAHSLHAQCAGAPVVPLEQRLQAADHVLEGLIIDRYAFRGADGRTIYTANLIEVSRVFKGGYTEPTIELITLGGYLGDEGLEVHPELEVHVDNGGIFLLADYHGNRIYAGGKSAYRPAFGEQSYLPIQPTGGSVGDFTRDFERLGDAYRFIERTLGTSGQVFFDYPIDEPSPYRMTPVITGGPQDSIVGGVSVITLTGSGFGTTPGSLSIRNGNRPISPANNLILPGTSVYVQSWTDTEIVLRYPDFSTTGPLFVRTSSGSQGAPFLIKAKYSLANYGSEESLAYYIDDLADGNHGYFFQYSNYAAPGYVSMAANLAANGHFDDALSTWQQGTGLGIYGRVAFCGDTPVNAPAGDDVNVVMFDNDIWDIDVEVSSTARAVAFTYVTRPGGTLDWEIASLDVVFDRQTSWYYGPVPKPSGPTDFETVALHELGHIHQHKHSGDLNGLMNWSSPSTGTTGKRTLSNHNREGGNFINDRSEAWSPPIYYPGSSSIFGQPRQYNRYARPWRCTAVLPVSWQSFEARAENRHSVLDWRTAAEYDNARFDIERSTDGERFVPIGKQAGAGTAHSERQYRFVDTAPPAGVSYYRIAQVDYDGTTTYSEVRTVTHERTNSGYLYPNPVSDNLFWVDLRASESPIVDIMVYDAAGRLHYRTTVGGETPAAISVRDWPNGIYLLEAQAAGYRFRERLIKL